LNLPFESSNGRPTVTDVVEKIKNIPHHIEIESLVMWRLKTSDTVTATLLPGARQ
jgi:hypothetical protein